MKTHRRDAGFSLAAMIFFATAASIFIAAAVPVYQMQAKRELEKELIFRGGEYSRAIQKYRNRFGVYPNSIDQLVSTNGLRFLRRAYKDPITGKDFRLLTLNPDGSLNGSKIFQQNMKAPSMFGNQTTPGAANSSQQPFQSQNQGQGQGQNQQQPGGFGANSGGFNSPGSSSPLSGQQQNQQQQPFQQQSSQQQQNPFQPQQQNSQQPQSGQGFGTSSGFSGAQQSGQRIGGGGIVGIASDSDKDSVMLYNNRQKYNEWEFIAIPNQQQGGQANPMQPNGQNPANGQQQSNPFQPSGSNPFGNRPSPTFGGATQGSTFGGATGNSPFGTGQGTTQTPFGTTNTPPAPGK